MDAALQSLVDTVRTAAARGTPLRIRGGGSKDFYGPPTPGALLDTTGHAGVICHEPSELVVTARAGTPLAALESLLAERGQGLAFEPPHFGPGATVGGMVAAGLSGPARASVGAVRDYLLGATLLNGRGELLTFGGQVMKNVAGYDVSRLLAGSLGTLGVITEVSLKVLPLAPAEATLRFECGQAEALEWLDAWGGRPLPLNASRWLEGEDGVGTLCLRLRGAAAAVEAACRRLGGARLDTTLAAADWAACREQRLPWFTPRAGHALWRLSLPLGTPVLEALARWGEPLLEWHGAQRWLHAPAEAAAALRQVVAEAGGHATLFRACDAGWAGAEGRFHPLQPALDRIHRRLKAEFDPAGIFNPGRLVPGL